jgi:tetratricopeptide (TPR) repeat protein
MTTFMPIERMRSRVSRAMDESDALYFSETLLLGELTLKLLIVELLALVQDERDQHRYALESRLVRSDSLGDWTQALDEMLQGPTSQHFSEEGRDSQRALNGQFAAIDSAWQRQAVDKLLSVAEALGITPDFGSQNKTGLRQWARLFVAIRNATRGHGAPLPAAVAAVAADLKASIDLVGDNAPAFRRPWAYVRRQLSGRMRASHFAGDPEPFKQLRAEDAEPLSEGVYVVGGGMRRVPMLFTDPDLTDFYLPNGAYRSQQFEVLSYITGIRRRQDAAEWTVVVETLPLSETAALKGLDVVGEAFANLPPRGDGYVSRPGLEKELLDLIRRSRHAVITLQGRGGVGKTSLALQVLHEVARSGEFSIIVWFSARDIDLLPEGPRVVRADVLTRDEMARDFASLLGRDLKAPEALALMSEALSGKEPSGPYLFVFDNFETVRDPSDLYEFVSNSIRDPSKALITTRTRSFKGDFPVEITGMERNEFSALVQATSNRLGIAHLVDKGFEKELFEHSNAHPYIAKVILGEIARRGKKLSIDRAVANNDRMLDALFERSFSALSPAAQRVFLTLCSWRSLVPRIGLEAAIRRPGNEPIDVERAIDELIQTSLVEQLDDDEFEDAFLSVPLAASTFGRQKLVASPLQPAIESDLEIVRGFGAVKSTEAKRGLLPRVERFTQELAKRSSDRKFFEQGLAVLQYIATSFAPAWRLLSELQMERGLRGPAIQSQTRYVERFPEDAQAWAHLVTLYQQGTDRAAELNARLQYAENANPPFVDLMDHASRLIYLLSRKDFSWDADVRKRSLERLREMIEAQSEEANARELSKLGWICMHLQDLDGARHWAERGLAMDPGNAYCASLLERIQDGDKKRARKR